MAFLPLKKFVPEGTDELLVCGLDEVGRGPWAGPIVACAFMSPRRLYLPHLKDSKKLTEEKRNEFYKIFLAENSFGVGMAEVEEIDNLGLLKANNLAFKRAVEDLKTKGYIPEFIVVDGRDRLSLPHPWKTIIKGDEKIKLIACASIIAKVLRDGIMEKFGKKYPNYGFESHKGYGTREHQLALKKYGATEIHRKSFAPVHELLQMTIE